MSIEREKRDHFPFVRAPIRPIHLIPIIGGIMWFRDERRIMDAIPEDVEIPDKGWRAELTSVGVTTWPEPRTPKEKIEHMKTQAIHGAMLGYHLIGGPIGLPILAKELSKLLFRAESGRK